MDATEWRPVPGFGDRYCANAAGQILVKNSGKGGHGGSRLLKSFITSAGYETVKLHVDKRQITKGVHQLVTLAFGGEYPDEYEINHIDGDKLNNKPENLEYLRRADHRRYCHSKLSPGAVWEIKQLLRFNACPQRAIAAKFGVSEATITLIKQGKTWNWKRS